MNAQHTRLRGYLSSKLAMTVCLLLIAAVGVGVWKVFFERSDVRNALLSLKSAYNEQRPLETRISALNYAPFSATRAAAPVPHNAAELRRAELTLLEAKVANPVSEVHHALGLVYLTQKRFEDAVSEFEEALKGDPNNATLLSDTGAAWLEKAKIGLEGPAKVNDQQGGKAVEALGHSLTYLNRGLAEDDKPLDAIFNRALCFQYLRLRERAQVEWHEYLNRDGASAWADEARNNLRALEQQADRSSHMNDQVLSDFLAAHETRDEEKAWNLISATRDDLSGTSISQQLLDRYLESSTKGETDKASQQLEALSYVAALEVKRGDEHYNSHIAQLYRTLTLEQKAQIAKARNSMRTGYRMYEQAANVQDMLRVFNDAADAFEQAGDKVEVHHARFWIAYTSLGARDTQRSLALFTELASDCARMRYRWLLMRATQAISSARYNLKEYSKSIEYSLEALGHADKVGDQIGAFNALDFLTEVYRAINNHEQAMNSISRSQSLLDCCAFNPIKIWRHYGIVAFAFYSAGSHSAAIEFQREALRRAHASADPQLICTSYAHLGVMLGRNGNYDEALANAKSGYETAAMRLNGTTRTGSMAYSSLQAGHLYRERGDCDNALTKYDESIALYESMAFSTHLYQAHKGRLLCYLKQNNHKQASAELNTALTMVDNNRSKILEGDNRNKFFDIEQSIYDLAIEYAYETQKDGVKAFTYSEASRARSLLDLMLRENEKQTNVEQNPGPVFAPFSLSEIKQKLPEANQIVEYTVLESKILIWVIDRNDAQVKESRISRAELESRVGNYLRSIADPKSEDVSRQGKELFDLLIKPVAKLLDSEKQLNIIPDKILNSLPFDSLVSTSSGRFLIEDYSLSYAPSASVLVLASAKAGTIDTNYAEHILAVGNPTFDQERYGLLANLKDAAKEAGQVKQSYKRGTVLIGPAATKRNILTELPKSDVAHFALHSIEEPHDEMHSRLVLARDQNGSGPGASEDVLEAREIYEMRLPATRLVILSACQTGTGRYYRGEGTFSVARAFMASGVPVVVASLWAVDSEATAELMINLHQIRKQQRLPTAEALRRAQLRILQGNERFRHPYYWAAFLVYGGSEKSSVNLVSRN